MCGGTTVTFTVTARIKQVRILEYLCVYGMFMILSMLLRFDFSIFLEDTGPLLVRRPHFLRRLSLL